jgi:Predicted membrane protein (DUF2232)
MTEAVASEIAATAPRERRWRWFVLALVLMVLVTAAPAWPASLSLLSAVIRLLLPVEQFALLVLVAIGSSAIIGWWSGGRLEMTLLWVVVAGYVIWKLPLPFTGYGAFGRGWALTLGASFGLVCLASPRQSLLTRALGAIGLAAIVTTAGLTTRTTGGSTLFDGPAQMLSREYQRRLGESLQSWRSRSDTESWRGFAQRFPEAADRATQMENLLVALTEPLSGAGSARGLVPGPLVSIAPALLALESLLALGLGWAAYHRLSRVRIGPPLGALRDVRFNDQLVWGVVVGVTVLLLPTLAEWRTVGANLFCFFGSLYAFRGACVLTWWIPDRLAIPALLALVVLVPILGSVWVVLAVLAVTFSLGLGDTWRDFRAGAQPRRSSLR